MTGASAAAGDGDRLAARRAEANCRKQRVQEIAGDACPSAARVAQAMVEAGRIATTDEAFDASSAATSPPTSNRRS
ncbi:MAG: hypothetical protein U0531_07505 [Dehalococcoidia bacterium]